MKYCLYCGVREDIALELFCHKEADVWGWVLVKQAIRSSVPHYFQERVVRNPFYGTSIIDELEKGL